MQKHKPLTNSFWFSKNVYRILFFLHLKQYTPALIYWSSFGTYMYHVYLFYRFRLDKKVIWKYLKNEPQGLKEWLITKTSENLDVTFNIVNYIVLLKKTIFETAFSIFIIFELSFLWYGMPYRHIDAGNNMIRNIYFSFQLSYMTLTISNLEFPFKVWRCCSRLLQHWWNRI